MGDILVGGIIFILVLLALRSYLKQRKSGGCGCGCEGCEKNCAYRKNDEK